MLESSDCVVVVETTVVESGSSVQVVKDSVVGEDKADTLWCRDEFEDGNDDGDDFSDKCVDDFDAADDARTNDEFPLKIAVNG